MSISNNYIPEKINDFNTYLDGNKMIGVRRNTGCAAGRSNTWH